MPAALPPLPAVGTAAAAAAASTQHTQLQTHTYCLLLVAALAALLLLRLVDSRHSLFSRWRCTQARQRSQQEDLARSWCPEKEVVASAARTETLAPGQQRHQQPLRMTESEGSSRGISSDASTAISNGLRIAQKNPVAFPPVHGIDARTHFSPLPYHYRSAYHSLPQHRSNMASPRPSSSDMAREQASASARSSSPADAEPSNRQVVRCQLPPPPLTPPTLAASVFTLDDCRPEYAQPIPSELDGSSSKAVLFIHQPNPDYAAEVAPIDMEPSPSSPSTSPRRRSYTKLVRVGTPVVPCPVPFDDPMGAANQDGSPASFPPTSPVLPPPPPIDGEPVPPRQIGVHGEIISVMDDTGAGWKRHTRVYGGGVCLACLAAEGGGVYGDKEPAEERR